MEREVQLSPISLARTVLLLLSEQLLDVSYLLHQPHRALNELINETLRAAARGEYCPFRDPIFQREQMASGAAGDWGKG